MDLTESTTQFVISGGIGVGAMLVAIAAIVGNSRAQKNPEKLARAQLADRAEQKQLQLGQHASQDNLAKAQADLAEVLRQLAAVNAKEVRPPVAWRTERTAENRWILRNIGNATASQVEIDRHALTNGRVDFLPRLPADLGPNQSVQIMLIASAGLTPAHELHVSWRGGKDVVPL